MRPIAHLQAGTKDRPILSVVTIMLNAKEGFSRTAHSLADLPDGVEWVVVDGGSTDGSLAEIEARGSQIARMISEPDDGIADAFNKGIALAAGDYVMFMNAGDCLEPGAMDHILKGLDVPNPPVVLIGQIRMTGRVHGQAVSFRAQCRRNHLPHQAMVLRRSLFRLLGGFDKSFFLGMDYEWSLRLKPFWDRMTFVPKVFADMEGGGVSITRYRDSYDQYHRARVKHCGPSFASKAISEFYKAKVGLGRIVRSIRGVRAG